MNVLIGKNYNTTEGYQVKIINYINNVNITIMFNDEKRTVLNKVAYKEIKTGHIKNPNHLSICNIGYYGQGVYKTKIQGKHLNYYLVWRMMILRCYDKKLQEKHPTYIGCTVCKEWHDFQNFAKWFEENYNYEKMDKWQLDKDILVKGNKIYSPETCCFVPTEINNLFTIRQSKTSVYPIGVRKANKRYVAYISKYSKQTIIGTFDTPDIAHEAYKISKKRHINTVANEWKDKIKDSVYQAMYNY